jgi:dienelactone hydrolase
MNLKISANRRSFLARLGAGACGSLMIGSGRLVRAAAGPAVAGGTVESQVASDVGSLLPLIEAEAGSAEPDLSFLQSRFHSAKNWRKTARAKWFDLLSYHPERCTPNPEIVEKVDCGSYVREQVYFNTTPHFRVPAYVLIPKGLSKPAPAIVALHDHGGFYMWGKEKLVRTENQHPALADWQNKYYGGNSIADVLAQQGYVVIVTDAFYWGERRMLMPNDPADWRERPPDLSQERLQAFNKRASDSEDVVGRTIFVAGLTWSGISVWNDLRTVDYLMTRPEVDRNRLGCVGLSMGGLRSGQLAAGDERIKAGVVVGWMASFPAQLRNKVRFTVGHTNIVPGLYRHLDYPDLISLTTPRALLVINGTQDHLFDLDGVRVAFNKLKQCYAKAGAPGKFRGTFYDAPHRFNAEMQKEAWDWLKRWV